MALNMNTITGTLKPIGNRVLVTNMHFGEQRTRGGLIISNDDGQTRGIYPRWGQVHAKGPENKDSYNIGDWVLIEHGRWTRGFEVEMDNGTIEMMRTVEAESIHGWQSEQPDDVVFGNAVDAGDVATARPEDFGAGA